MHANQHSIGRQSHSTTHSSRAVKAKGPSQGSVRTMAYIGESLQRKGWLSRLAATLLVSWRARDRQLLDVNGLSDHLKRDMGFLDGVPTVKRR